MRTIHPTSWVAAASNVGFALSFSFGILGFRAWGLLRKSGPAFESLSLCLN